MDLNVSTKDLWKLLKVSWVIMAIMVVAIVFLFGKFGVLKMANTMQVHDQNFGIIQNWQKDVEGRFQRLELANQIQGNIIETGKLDDKGNPVKK